MNDPISTGRPKGYGQYVAGVDTRTPPPLPSNPMQSAGLQAEVAPTLAMASSLDGSKRSNKIVALVALTPVAAMIVSEIWQLFG